MRFSPDDRSLLSVSRDRKWALFERTTSNDEDEFRLVASTNKQNGVHARIIWTCDWSHESTLFATGSRDGKCAVWRRAANGQDAADGLGGYTCAGVFETKESITAVSFGKSYLKRAPGSYVIALGCESGIIKLCSFDGGWEELCTVDVSEAHHLTVRKLAFRPKGDGKENSEADRHVLASCGNDHMVRIHEFTF